MHGPARVIDAQVAGDAVDPRREPRLSPPLIFRLYDPQEDLLQQILRQRFIPDGPPQEVPHPAFVSGEELFERADVTAAVRLQELLVGGVAHGGEGPAPLSTLPLVEIRRTSRQKDLGLRKKG